MYLDDLRKRVAEREAQVSTTKTTTASPSANYLDDLRNRTAEREASLAGKTTKLREEYKINPVSVSGGSSNAPATNRFYGADPKTVDIGALDAEIEKNRKAREKALADYDAAYAAKYSNMQGVVDNRSWEEKYAERSAVTESYEKDIAALHELRELANSVQYQAAGEKALSELDADTLEILDNILAGVPQNTEAPMQGIADNRSWEEIYAENEAYMDVFRQAMRDKGYTPEETEQLADYRQRQRNKELYDLAVQKAVEEAESGVGGAISASAKSVPQNLTGGLGYLAAVSHTAHNKLTGKDRPLDVYAPEFVGSAAAKAARESVSRQLEENTNWEISDTNVASFLYNTGMSMADSVASSVIGRVLAVPTAGITTDAAKKFASNAAGVVLGGSVATNALVEAKERGVSDERALITGLAFGAAEGFFEKHSIDRWFGNKAVKGLLRDRVKQTLKNTGAQIITEGSEELATSIADTIADGIINGNLSDLNTRIRNYVNAGYTEAEAHDMVSKELMQSLVEDFIAGAISGGVMGGVSTGINTLIESKDVSDYYGDSAQELVAETLELDPENKTAQKAQAKLDEGKKLNPTVIRSLLLDNREYIEREESANPTPEDTVEQEERVALTRPEDMTEEEAADIIEQASVEFGEAAGVFKSAYSATQDPYQYASAAKVAYAAGRTMGAKAMQYAANSKNTIGLEGWQIKKLVEEGRQAIAKEIKTVSAVKGKGKLVIPNTIKSELLTNKQNTDIRVLDALAKITGYTVELYESTINENGEYVGENGSYSPEEGVIRIDINAGKNRVDDIAEYALVRTMSHELTHSFQKNAPAEYQKLRELVLDIIAEEGKTLDDLVSYKKARAIKGDLTDEQAFDEVVADACEMLLRDSNAVQRLVNKDRNLAQRVFDWIKQFFADLAKAFNGVSAAHQEALIIEKRKEEVLALWDSAFEMSMSNLSTAKEASTDFVAVEDTTNYSFRSLAEAAGFSAMELEDGRKVFLRNGEVVNNVTVEDIDNSPIGALINASLKEVDGKVVWKYGISESDAQAQKEMFAKLCNIAINTNDFNMAMQFAGSTVFTAMKANSDKQYKTTYDFPSICTKTQAVIDQMSTAMVSLGRGLTDKEILELYDKVHFNGLPVPCPECYVFSRWIGIGGLLDNIKKYQTKYGDMTPAEVAKAYDDIKEKVEQKVAESGGKLSSGKAKGKLHSELQKKYNDALERVQKAENQGGTPTKKDLDTVAEIEPLLTDIKAMSWIDTVYFTDPSHKTRRKNWEVPDDVLFDLNKGEIFASQYKAAWAFRTTQGAGYGKAITPYAEAVIGEGILVNNNTTKTIKQKAAGVLNNPFLTQRGKLDKPTASMLKTARAKQLAQAFLGGQRFQSTSDARYENASDYLIAVLELQAMGGMAQVYTKVDGAVPAFAAWGMAINQSLMPKDGGLVDGKIADTPVGGMKPSVAFENRKKFDTAGTITIGVNDNHIRAMFDEWVRDFIIPYHASGGKATTVAEMRRIQEGEDVGKTSIRSTDYTRTQSDKVLSNEVLRWMGKTPEEIKLIEDRREARLALLSGKKADMDVVRGSTYLTELHRRLNEEWKGVKLAKSTVESHIFPNEFWDESVDYDHSAKIVEDYLAYCEELGFLHRFSGLIPHRGQLRPAKGYDENGNRVELTDLAYQYDENGNKTDLVEPFFWKVLTDRRMYGNDKKYLPQQRVKLDTDPETTANFAKVNDGRAYDKSKSAEMSAELKARIEAAKLYSERTTDSNGRHLSKEQQEYFKDSKVRDADGRLKVVYHGSTAIFTEFDLSFMGRHGSAEGQGIYFTDSKTKAEGYQNADGQLMEGYLLISKPLSDSKLTLTRAEVRKLLAALDPTGDDIVINFDPSGVGYPSRAWYNRAMNAALNMLMDGNDTDTELMGEIANINGDTAPVLRMAREVLGYDGYIVEGKYEDATVYVAFESNQFKSVENENPTTDPDIRYSERDYGILSDRGFGIPSNRTLIVRYEANEHDSKGLLESVERYKEKAEELKKAQSDLRYLRKKLEKTPETNSEKYREVLDSATRAKNRVEAITAEMNRIESGKAMQELISRELKVVSVSRAEAAKRVAKYRERLNATETRRKLRDKITYRVKTLDKMLRNPTDDKHIPDGLQGAIFDFCELFTEEKGVWYGDRLASVKARYEELKPKADSEFSEFSVMDLYDESIPDMLQYLAEHLNGNRLAELTKSELEMVLAIADHFAFMVKNENEIFFGNRKANLAETVKNLFAEAGENSATEYVVGNDAKSFRKARDFITTKNLKPIYFFRNKGDTLKTLFDGMLKAPREYALKMKVAKAFAEKTKKDLNYDEWFDPDAKLVMKNDAGQRIELTIQQAMSLVATYEREVRSGESYHTTQGGFIYAGEVLGKVETKGGKKVPFVKKVNAKETYEAHPMSVTDMAKVIGWLREISPNTIVYVEKMVNYLSSDLADIGNDVCKKLFGYKKFWDEFYFPIKSSSDFLKSEPGQIGKDESRWKHKGFTKRRIPNANNAFVLDDFDSVWENHTSEMLMFATMAIPQDSFVRVLNYNTAVDKEGLTPPRSTKNVIETAYGISALHYIDTLLRDVNGGVVVDPREGAYGNLLSIFKKGATALSASVAIQQPSALVRALMYIDLKYIRKGMANPNFNEALKHSGLAVLKTIGGYDTTTGKAGADWLMSKTPEGIGNKVKAAFTFGKNDTGYRDELLYWLPQKMDELSWGILWSAVEAEVADTTNLEKGSDAYWETVTNRFDEIIELTQVYDSVLTRSENMRAKTLAMKAATAFGAEATTTLNIAAAALQDFVAKKPNAKKNLAKATVVLLSSIAVNSILKSIVTAARDKDEDETYAEKYLKEVLENTISDVSPLGYFPFLRDIESMWQGYTNEDKTTAPIADVFKAVQAFQKDSTLGNAFDIALQSATLMGVPLENLWRDITSVYNVFFKSLPISETSKRGLYNAFREGVSGIPFYEKPDIGDAMEDAYRADSKNNEKARTRALNEIRALYEDKVKEFRVAGKENPAKSAKASVKSSVTAVLKPLYQAATTSAERNRIIALARRVYVGGEQLYKDYNFAKNWAADE